MGFSVTNGYTASSIATLMDYVRQGVNTQFGTTYTTENFVGSNFYKYFYALIQKLQENEVKTAEIFVKLQDYFNVTNERISRPVATAPGLIEKLLDEGYIASVKPPSNPDAGKVYVCVDIDDEAEYPTEDYDSYEDEKDAINLILSQSVALGNPTQGTESTSIVLSNGQAFDFKYALPDRVEPLLRLTIVTSENNQFAIKSPTLIKQALMANIAAKYALGKNFEPQRYFSIIDAPWAATILLEYSLNAGADWSDDVFDAAYDDLFEIDLANISLVES